MALDPGTLLQILFWGLYAGCIYILLATGVNLIFGVMKTVNFAHGELLMIGAYVTWSLFVLTGVNPYLLLVATVPVLLGLGVAVERLAFRPVLGAHKLNEIFLSIGLIYLFQNGAALLWGDDYQSLRSPFEAVSIPIADFRLPLDYLIIIGVTVAILVGLQLLLRRTRLGLALRATSQNRKAAMLSGIDVERMDMLAFGLGAALAGAAGTLWAVSGQVFDPYMGSVPAIKAFAIVILGGLGSIPGAILGGLFYGLAESTATYTLGGAWKDAISFVLLIVVLVIRPTGLFGERGE
ncbi:MAG TPA: branched-chain amino acid ABC transporter permease [Methanoregulaceae archaeon]|nr:branched-chain amino acid ABC transporter permease [Methanoregulaceae archaeon]HOV66769.1 branched-chain amino acid ABC transporter permease [Methanoregulaceae archaeon]HQJ87953.1 branched-chain amino acid ABC transporter permease [Methanoregulaceae archaeon]